MIEEIRIKDLGVISDAQVPLSSGFTVVTGETGAGKTMVVTAVGLLLGARADSGMVRSGADSASVEATALLAAEHPAVQEAEEAGATVDTYDDGAELLLARSLSSQGRSKAFLGGRGIPVGMLAQLGEELVTVHGQADQIRLRTTSAQREALDAFAAAQNPEFKRKLQEHQEKFLRYTAAQAQHQEIASHSAQREKEGAELREAFAEITAVDPQPGEDAALKAESIRLSHLEALRLAAAQAREALSAEEYPDAPDALTLIAAAQRAMAPETEHDAQLEALATRLSEAEYLLADIAQDLGSYLATVDTDTAARLAEIEARRGQLATLTRKYAPTVDEVLAWMETAQQRLVELEDPASSLAELAEEIEQLDAELQQLSIFLHQAREQAAKQLSDQVTVELAALAMPDARLEVTATETERSKWGNDEIAFLLTPHPGSAPRPVAKGASGGELSRVMLALEVVLAASTSVPSFVFDEVDAGVGGKAAVEIGRRLAKLAQRVQVLVVTHLPQVAAFADQHIRVLKNSKAEVTASDITVLDQAGRVQELARMLAGQEESESARAHAEELLTQAQDNAAQAHDDAYTPHS